MTIFVIHKHAAHTLHYDVRIEIDGALISWVVPKGPPLNYGERRLALYGEDHKLSYAAFEGVIPSGEYGAGAVMIWDHGTYKNLRKISMRESIESGLVEVYFVGERLRGPYALIKTKSDDNKWLCIKKHAAAESANKGISACDTMLDSEKVTLSQKISKKSKISKNVKSLSEATSDCATRYIDIEKEYTTSIYSGKTMAEIAEAAGEK